MMKAIKKIGLSIGVVLFANLLLAQTISLQGVLRDPSGKSVEDGFYDVTFTIYDVGEGGSALWSENYPSLETIHGVFNVNLGSVNTLEPTLAFDRQYYVGITVDPYVEMTPRLEVTIYPYAKSILGQDNKFPSIGDVEMANDDFILSEGSLRITGTGGAIVFNDGTSLNTANFGGPAGSVGNPTNAVINADQDADGSGQIDLQVGGISQVRIADNAAFFDDVILTGDQAGVNTTLGNDFLQAYNAGAGNTLQLNPLVAGNIVANGTMYGPSFYAGDEAALHTFLSPNQLAARNGTGNSTLYLNHGGGDVNVGNGAVLISSTLADFAGGLTALSYLQSGDPTAAHLDIYSDNIQGFTGTTPSAISFNPGGGNVNIGDVAGFHLAMTVNRIQAVNGTAATPFHLNYDLGGSVNIGQPDVHRGVLYLHGSNTGLTHGGAMVLETAADHDASVSHYSMQVEQADLLFGHNGAELLRLTESGNVGIGDVDPAEGRLVIGAPLTTYTPGSNLRSYFVQTGGLIDHNNIWSNASISLYAKSSVASDVGFYVVSDARIKEVEKRTNSSADLDMLNSLQVTDYSFIDKVKYGNKVEKRLIAQEVKDVFPQAISMKSDFVPNIYSIAETKYNETSGELTATIPDDHELVTGDKVKLITEDGELNTEVIKVLNHQTFVVASEKRYAKVFVYGKYVDDFHIVDYDAISMLNVSATQELSKQLELLKKENVELRAKLSKLEVMEAKLNTLLGVEEPTSETQISKQ